MQEEVAANDTASPGVRYSAVLKSAVVASLLLITFGVLWFINVNSDDLSSKNIPPSLLADFETDFSKTTLNDFSSVVSGGPGKDQIPAIQNPKFEPIEQTSIAETTRGVLVEVDGVRRFYPYNILVWHEIVNDQINDVPFSVTFCPLCGSAIVYDRRVDDQVLEFGVSGFLRESNMIMYDRTNESLWQQSTGESFAGESSGKQLEIIQFQLMELFLVKEQFPDTRVMTTNTGHSRDYTVYPYGNYDNSDDLFYFDVSVDDARYPAKEIFYVVPLGEQSVALRIGALNEGEPAEFAINGSTLEATRQNGILNVVQDHDNSALPGYYEMWFSWATWHQEDGVVWEPESHEQDLHSHDIE